MNLLSGKIFFPVKIKNAIIYFLTITFFFIACGNLKRMTYDGSQYNEGNPIVNIASVMTKELRQLIASYFWLRCDEYFHSTSSSLRGNSEIVPLLKIAVIFDPALVDAYIVLSYQLSSNLGKPAEALKTINEAIDKNTDKLSGIPLNARISDLYMESAFVTYFEFHKTGEALILTQNAIRFKTDECDPEYMNFADILYRHLINYTAEVNLNSKLASFLNKKSLKNDKHDCACSGFTAHNDTGQENENLTTAEIEFHRLEHAYSGQNPWNKPFLNFELHKLKVFYSAAAIILMLYLIAGKIIVRY